jgi:hypothetical protein
MNLEVNAQAVEDPSDTRPLYVGSMRVLYCPPVGEDFWLARVQVATDQAVVCFPKFTTVGIGFQRENDWNTNLPYTSKAAVIYDHIKHNKDCPATREACIEAIEALQVFAAGWLAAPVPEGRKP